MELILTIVLGGINQSLFFINAQLYKRKPVCLLLNLVNGIILLYIILNFFLLRPRILYQEFLFIIELMIFIFELFNLVIYFRNKN